MIRVYRKQLMPEWGIRLVPVHLTRKWRLEIIDGEPSIYVQYRGWLLKHWCHESDIVIRDELIFNNNCIGEE